MKCPRCRRIVQVPEEEALTADSASARGASPAAASPPDVSPTAGTAPAAEDVAVARRLVAIPRYVLYAQGLLLGVVALVFFVFGLMVGSRSAVDRRAGGGDPLLITGRVLVQAQSDTPIPDARSMLLLLPASRSPDERFSAAGLEPDAPPPAEDHPALATLRRLGGDYARADRRGGYRLRAGGAGRYYMLVVSRRAERGADEPLQASTLAQLGRYFRPPTQLLGQRRYTWKELWLRHDTELDFNF